MIIIADSGSTKTTWCTLTPDHPARFFSTSGINPFFRTSADIAQDLSENLLPLIPGKVEKVFFYGAGIVNPKIGEVVLHALRDLFPGAEAQVNSDLLAAARALLQDHPGIACILGTGSNSCFYDGQNIRQHVPPLGFILGDEGSGAVIGKKLLADFLKGLMPAGLAESFQSQFPVDYAGFLEKVYRGEKPNMFLASLVPFVSENISHPYCSALVERVFDEFIGRNLSQYPGYKTHPVGFVGSVAYYFKDQLQAQLEKSQIRPGMIIKEPMQNLILYHAKHN